MTARQARRLLLIAVVIAFPWLPGVPYSAVVNGSLAAEYSIIAFSLVVLTGWVGQISLGQGAFVGIGAFLTGVLTRRMGIPFPVTLPIVAAVTAGVAALLGMVALRVRGLYLAVATLIFAWLADAYLFTSSWLVGKGGSSSIEPQLVGERDTATFFDLSDKRVLWIVMVAAVGTLWFAAVNLRDSKTGRAFFAIRGGEIAAASLGIAVTRYKLLAFGISGALAGIAGNLIMIDLRAVTPFSFQFTVSLFYLAIAVVGGITSLGGAIGAGVLFAALAEAFFRIRFLNGLLDIVTVALLLAVLLVYPGGLGALGLAVTRRSAWLSARLDRAQSALAGRLRERVEALRPERAAKSEPSKETGGSRMPEWARTLRARLGLGRGPITRRSLDLSRLDAAPVAANGSSPTPNGSRPASWKERPVRAFSLPSDRSERAPILEAEHIVVCFGGLVAVNDVSVTVREHEIVGLIGPNGAGKTTTFNAISGLNEPTSGSVRLFGEDATSLPVHLRARMGVGRTFQLIQLFPQLTVFENLLVATHLHNDTGVGAHVLLTDRAIAAERDCRQRVRQVVAMLGLQAVAERKVSGLPFGVLRHVEIARALVTEAPFIMLDEPASGLDNAETHELAQLLYFLRAELGVSILLIEHDVRMVTSVSDYMYVINRGLPLAEGPPAVVQRNPDVIAAYLGSAVTTPEGVGV